MVPQLFAFRVDFCTQNFCNNVADVLLLNLFRKPFGKEDFFFIFTKSKLELDWTSGQECS